MGGPIAGELESAPEGGVGVEESRGGVEGGGE